MATMQDRVKGKWQPTLSRYKQGQRAMKAIYKDMLRTFQNIVESKVLGDGITIEELISQSDKDTMEKCLVVKPSIAFIGQVNAGKSSLANELIGGGTWLPVAPEPCTSRMVRLEYSKNPYKQKIPFHGVAEHVKKQPLTMKENRLTAKDIRLSDEEKKDPEVFKVEFVYGVPNPHLFPDLAIIDLPGWSEKETLNAVIEEAVEKVSSPVLVLIYVLDGNQTLTAVDRQLIKLLTRKVNCNQLFFVCNKIDHEEENLCADHGVNGKLDVSEDGSAIFTVDGHEKTLLNKAQASFDSLKNFGFVHDSETGTNYNSSNFFAVSARMSKAQRTTGSDDTTQFKYCQQQYDNFSSHLNSRLDRVLMQHVLGMVRSATVTVSRFAEGAITTRREELSADLHATKLLREAAAAEQTAYSKCREFLSKEIKAIEDAVSESFSAARTQILKQAMTITARHLLTETNQGSLPLLATEFVESIAFMARCVMHHEIAHRIDTVKQKYVADIAFFTHVLVGGCGAILNDIIRNIYQPKDGDVVQMVRDLQTSDETLQAGVDLLRLIPVAVAHAIREVFPYSTISRKMLTHIVGVGTQMVQLDDKWKESIAQEYLTMIEVEKLAPAILKHCCLLLDERHERYVQTHKQMMTLREAKSGRNQEDNERLRTDFTPKIALLLLRLYALGCALEKGEPEKGDQIGEGRHSAVSTCPSWGALTTPNALVVKTFNHLPQELWNELAQSFYVTRTIQGIDETDKYVVKLYGALLSPLDGKGEEQRLILVMERRATTLPEALRRGLSRDERKQIAFDIGNALSFLHEKSLIHENLTADCVLLDDQNRAKIDVMKIAPCDYSWLGCPAFLQAPEVYLDENTRNRATDVYSFGILLWEIFSETTQPPEVYADCTNKEDMKKKVCDEGARPSKPDHLSDEWYSIMQDCWKEPANRPPMNDLTIEMKALLLSNQVEEG